MGACSGPTVFATTAIAAGTAVWSAPIAGAAATVSRARIPVSTAENPALIVLAYIMSVSPSRLSAAGPGSPDRLRVPAVRDKEVVVKQGEVVVQECEVMLTFDGGDGKKYFEY
jgi:hypothetical protein